MQTTKGKKKKVLLLGGGVARSSLAVIIFIHSDDTTAFVCLLRGSRFFFHLYPYERKKFRDNAEPSAAKEALTPPCGAHLPQAGCKPQRKYHIPYSIHAVVMRRKWHTRKHREHDAERAG